MSEVDTVHNLISHLQRLAAERPKEARGLIGQLLDNRSPEIPRFLSYISAPGESRLRHLVANAVRVKSSRGEMVPQLAEWLATETDEFTRNALRGALESLGGESQSDNKKPKLNNVQPVDPLLVRAHRYAASRLAHRVRNSLTEPQVALMKLKHEIAKVPDAAVQAQLHKLVADLETGFQRVSRVAEYDVDDNHFEMRGVALLDWIRRMNVEYAQMYSAIDLSIEVASAGAQASVARVRASDYLLQTIFWNIWTNSHQAAGAGCRIVVRASVDAKSIRLLLLDNGGGFSPEIRDVAFVDAFSSKGKSRGRGLLEVQDAVERLHGDVRLVYEEDGLRLCLMFPLEDA